MNKVDWRSAPDGAEFYADGVFWKESNIRWFPTSKTWQGDHIKDPLLFVDYEPRPKEWPTDERINNIGLNRTTEDTGHYEQAEKPVGNKYDRTIYGKYGTGECTVDVYRVLDAFDTGSAEIDHAVKKLLCAGNRGAKDKLQDLQEAIQSIQSAIDLMQDKDLQKYTELVY